MSEILNPQDAELEEVILGACLIEREAMPMVADRLRPEMFYFEKNALIYAALQAMYRDGRQIDIITVKNELGARGQLDAAGRMNWSVSAAGWCRRCIWSIMCGFCMRSTCGVK